MQFYANKLDVNLHRNVDRSSKLSQQELEAEYKSAFECRQTNCAVCTCFCVNMGLQLSVLNHHIKHPHTLGIQFIY